MSPVPVRHRVGLLLGPTVFVLLLCAPLPDLSPQAQRLAAVGGLIVVYWISEAIPLAASALLGPALAVVLGVCGAKEAFAAFAHPLIFLFMGGFLLAAALSKQGFDRRAALWLVSRSFIAGSPRRALVALLVVAFSFSMWISNTATTAMLLPVALGLHATIGRAVGQSSETLRKFGGGMVLGLAYAASIGGIATPIGTAPNVIALALLEGERNTRIDFLAWMSFALPIAVVLLVAMIALILRQFPPPAAKVDALGTIVREELTGLGPMRPGERRALLAFCLAVAGWLAPSLCRLVLGSTHPWTEWAHSALDEGVVAILAACILFFAPSGGSGDARHAKILDWNDAQALDWGTLFLLGGGMALGHMAFETGLAEAMGRGALAIGGPLAQTSWGLVVLSTVLVLLLTEVTSNTATTSMMLPVLIGIAKAGGLDPGPAAIATTLAASCAFMLPVSTPPNAIAYGSGLIRIEEMVVAGIRLDLVSLVILLAGALLLVPAVL